MTVVDMKVELLVQGDDHPVWEDVTSDVRGEVSWTRGCPPSRSLADPSTCDVTFDNLTGKYNPRNPESPLYGSVQTGTPLRVRLDATAPAAPTVSDYELGTFTTTTVGGGASKYTIDFTTPTCVEGDMLVMIAFGRQLDGAAMPDGMWDYVLKGRTYSTLIAWKRVTDVAEASTTSFVVAPSGTFAGRAVLMAVSDSALEAPIVDVQEFGQRPPDVPIVAGLAIYGAGHTVNTAAPVVDTSSWDALDATLGTDWDTFYSVAGTASLPPLTLITRTSDTDALGASAETGLFTTTSTTFGYQHYFSVFIRSAPDPNVRYVGSATNWRQTWEADGADAVAKPVVSGVLTSLANVKTPSAMQSRYAASSEETLGYWPLEDGVGNKAVDLPAAQIGSVPASFGSGMTAPGTAGSMTIEAGTTSSRVSFPVNWTTRPILSGDEFSVELAFEFEPDTATGTVLILESGYSISEYKRFTVTLAATTWSWLLESVNYVTGAALTDASASGIARGTSREWHHVRIANWQWTTGFAFYATGITVDGTSYTEFGSSVGSIDTIQPAKPISLGATISVAHLYVGRRNRISEGRRFEDKTSWAALSGFVGESPNARVVRLCREADVWPACELPRAQSRMRMGVQDTGSLADILETVAVTDGGLLAETTDVYGIAYRPAAALYHVDPLTIDYTATTNPILDKQLEPFEDDGTIANAVTVKDAGLQSTFTVEQNTGPLGTAQPPEGIGVVPHDEDVSVASQPLLEAVANWTLAQRTFDAPYFRTIGVNLVKVRDVYADTTTADALEALRLGDQIWITNPPVWLPRGTNKLMVTEARETLNAVNHTIEYAARPADLYNPGIVADGTSGTTDVRGQRVDSDTTTLTSDIDTDDTTVTITVDTSSPTAELWTTNSDDWDGTNDDGGTLDILIGGEVMTVTNIATDSSTIAHDAATESATFTTTTPHAFNHTPTGTPKGVLVLIDHGAVSTDLITSVTYGGVAMTRVASAADTAGEPGRVYAYFLGENVPTGTKSVSIVHTGSADVKHAVAITVTASSDTQVSAYGILEGDQANPSKTLAVKDRNTLHYCTIYSGAAAVTDLTVLAGMSAVHDHDYGAYVSRQDRQTTADDAAFPIGYTSASDDVAFIAVGIRPIEGQQALTVTRSTNGVVKAHTAGDPVHVATPARVGL